jgi:hypothetical protein
MLGFPDTVGLPAGGRAAAGRQLFATLAQKHFNLKHLIALNFRFPLFVFCRRQFFGWPDSGLFVLCEHQSLVHNH